MLACVAAGCGGGSHAVAFRDLTAQVHGFQPPRLTRAALKTPAELASYFRHESPGAAVSLPRVDWKREEAIVVAAGPRSSTGYALRIVGVRETPHTITVTVHEDTPTLGKPVQARVTYPFRVIAVPRSPKKLFLHWPGRP